MPRDVTVRFIEKFGDDPLYVVFIPLNEKLTRFNFPGENAKNYAMKFVSDVVDGEFTDKEVEEYFSDPNVPIKLRKVSTGRPNEGLLREKEKKEKPFSHRWSTEVRKRFIVDFFNTPVPGKYSDVYKAAVKGGDTATESAWYQLCVVLTNQGILKRSGVKGKYRLQTIKVDAFGRKLEGGTA